MKGMKTFNYRILYKHLNWETKDYWFTEHIVWVNDISFFFNFISFLKYKFTLDLFYIGHIPSFLS